MDTLHVFQWWARNLALTPFQCNFNSIQNKQKNKQKQHGHQSGATDLPSPIFRGCHGRPRNDPPGGCGEVAYPGTADLLQPPGVLSHGRFWDATFGCLQGIQDWPCLQVHRSWQANS